eukprot:jgi/Undpi1/332/HiC_scaffold_1.g00328.m1
MSDEPRTCWVNKDSGEVTFSNPQRRGLAPDGHPNVVSNPVQPPSEVAPDSSQTWEKWERFTTEKDNRPYWHNRDTKEPQAKVETPESKTPESKKWIQVYDKRGVRQHFLNIFTGETQVERPACLVKYPKPLR